MKQQSPNNQLGRRALVVSLWIIAALLAGKSLWSGVFHSGVSRHLDAQWIYVAGRCWSAGESPYRVATFRRVWEDVLTAEPVSPTAFVYPPATVGLALPLALFDWRIAKRLHDAVNVAALCVIWWAGIAFLRRANSAGTRAWCAPLVIALSATMSAIPGVLYIGQMGLIATAGVAWAACSIVKRRSLSTAIGCALAMLKPQLTLLPILVVFLSGRWRDRLAIVTLWILCTGVGVLLSSPANLVGDYRASMEQHASMEFNRPAAYDHLGGFLAAAGLINMEGAMYLLAIAAVVGMHVFDAVRARTTDGNLGAEAARRDACSLALHLQIAVVLTVALFPLHAYDWVIVLPLFPLVLCLRGQVLRILWLLGLLLLGRAKTIGQLSFVSMEREWMRSAPTLAALVVLLALAVATWTVAVRNRSSEGGVARP